MRQVERIGCLNNGLFVMNFSIQWFGQDGKIHTSGWNSGNYVYGTYKVSPPLSSLGVPGDALGVMPYVSAVLGESRRGSPVVQPAGNGRVGTYLVTGTTLDVQVGPLPWRNWAENVERMMTVDGEYYFVPANRQELQEIVLQAVGAGATLRVSGQRHSQPPLVTADSRDELSPRSWLVDLACYRDLGPQGDSPIQLDQAAGIVTVNAGVREDELDAYLTANNLMLRTVTAGGFFSTGGMTAVDVHGATLDAPIFAETACAFDIMSTDGQVRTIDRNTPPVDGWSVLQFARVSLGALGIVTAVSIEVEPRPWATTLRAGKETGLVCRNEQQFIDQFSPLLTSHDRVESFLNPYSQEFLALWWDVDQAPRDKTPNRKETPSDACVLAGEERFGAPYLGTFEWAAEQLLINTQYLGLKARANTFIETGYLTVKTMFDKAASVHSDLWLTAASRVIFMSYFIELPAIDDAGLGKVWKGLDAVMRRLNQSSDFLVVAPLEFRFIRGGDTALAGTYTTTSNATFVNLDLIGYVEAAPASRYPDALLQFFADIEREWVGMGGEPHSGKMFGFYDPAQPAGSFSAPFNPAFLNDLARRRGGRIQAFNAYRRSCDPEGVFHNSFVAEMLGDR